MLYLFIQDCEKGKYEIVLKYIFSLCNKVSFHLPNFCSSGDYDIKYNNNGEKNFEYIEYLQKNRKITDLCFQKGAKRYTSNKYVGEKLAYNTQIVSVNLFSELKSLFLKHHLFEWKYPDLPEDVCFFFNEECKFQSVAHDGDLIMYKETKKDIDFFDLNGIEYMKIRDKK